MPPEKIKKLRKFSNPKKKRKITQKQKKILEIFTNKIKKKL